MTTSDRKWLSPKSVEIYANDRYVAVCVVRDGGTPEWVMYVVPEGKLIPIRPDIAEELARDMGIV